MKELQLFSNPEFGAVRAVDIDGEPWLVGKDVAQVLGYNDTDQALRKHVDDEDKLTRQIDGSGQGRSMTIINESGLYALALSSKLPGARKFRRWVTAEVLPAIRRTGGYDIPKDYPSALRALAESMERRLQLEAENEANRPKVLFADAVSAAKTSILVGELAKLLKQNGVDMGQNRLFSLLRDKGYLIRRQGTDFNMPTQRAMELGLFEIKETVIAHSDGHISVSKTPKITGKGQQYFVRLFLGGNRRGHG
ncbi:phage antirepressor KilAC domain-containing protein [uncultured Pseudoflavonifractor sp.]|uniref:phage antirepressor n=1 Tax=uncultured Pseudoflavonifractor sp. TaxID=1221379 RepID=UPI0025D69EED|nr:phage antirepressor KilAC domain-containing protein [uncultured Pseudoflavonifractor sp.]